VLTGVGLLTASAVGQASSMATAWPAGRWRLLMSRRGWCVGGDLVVVATGLEEGQKAVVHMEALTAAQTEGSRR
jgi:hypothetical protein